MKTRAIIGVSLLLLTWENASAQMSGPPPKMSRKFVPALPAPPPNNHAVWANDMGAICDGVTDDSIALQNTINTAAASGLPMHWLGICATGSTLHVPSSLEMSGGGPPNDQPNGPLSPHRSEILVTNNAVNGIQVDTAQAVYLHDLSVNYSSPPTGGQKNISVDPTSGINTSTKIERVNVYGGQNCVYLNNTQLFTITNSQMSCAVTAVTVAGTVNPDAGDSTIYGSTLQAGNQGTALLWRGSGGLRFENNKTNQNTSTPATGMAFGIRMQPDPGVRTSDIFIIGSSIEGLNNSVNGYGIFAQRADAVTSVGNVHIESNEIVARGCVYIPTDATAAWMGNVIVSNNTCGVSSSASAGSFGISIDGVVVLSIMGNTISNGGPTSTAIGSGSQGETPANCAIAYNPHAGNFGPSAPGACTTAGPF